MQMGYGGWTILLIILIGTLVVTGRVERSLKDNSPAESPRIKPGALIAVFVVAMLLVIGLLASVDYRAYSKLTAIHQHGRRADADVDSIYTVAGRSGPSSFYVRYHYVALSPRDGQLLPLTGNEYLGSKRADDPHFVYANTQRRVPIGYDVDNPQHSLVNFDDSIFSGAQERALIARAEGGYLTLLLGSGAMLLLWLVFFGAQRWPMAGRRRDQSTI